MKALLLSILTLLPLFLSSCASQKKEEEKEESKALVSGPEKQIIGRIASVARAGEFVLIQKFGPGTLPQETIYQSQGPAGRSASLKPSGERVRDFYAADLLSGNVEKGDAVIGYRDKKKEENAEDLTKTEESSDSPTKSPKPEGADHATAPQTIGIPD